jgi:hypothetical protein
MKKYIIILLIAITTLSFTAEHKFFVSVTQIDYIEASQSVQITSKLFIDDIERLLRERYEATITLSEANEPKIVNYYMDRYLKEKIAITINNKPVVINFLGKEYEDDIMVCYLEIQDVNSIETFQIQNTILFDLFEDQQNIVRTKIKGKNKSFILIKENDKGMLNFN